MTSAYSLKISTILPFPSSPHCAPTTTMFLAIILILPLPRSMRHCSSYVFYIKCKTDSSAWIAIFLHEAVVSPPCHNRLPRPLCKSFKDYTCIVIKAPYLRHINGYEPFEPLCIKYLLNPGKIFH